MLSFLLLKALQPVCGGPYQRGARELAASFYSAIAAIRGAPLLAFGQSDLTTSKGWSAIRAAPMPNMDFGKFITSVSVIHSPSPRPK